MITPMYGLLAAEEFGVLPPDGVRRELVAGEVVESMPPGGQHGDIAAELNARLRMWAKQGEYGRVGVEAGFVLRRDPDTVRGPDVFFVRADRVPSTGIPEGFWPFAPDLAVEVISPSESAESVREKVNEYLAAGTSSVWVVYPRTREVVVHTPNGLAQTYTHHDILEDATLLPGFVCPVGELFM